MTERGPLDLTIIGSGNAFAPDRCWSGFLLNGHALFDAPPTALYALKRLSQPLAAIDAVVISHFHADHFFGLPFLLLEYAYETRRSSDLTIVGPPGIETRLRLLTEMAYPALLEKLSGFALRFVEMEDGCRGEVAGMELEAVEVEHAGEALTCFGYRVETGGRSLAYTGDSQYCEQLLRLGRGVEVLVGDCTYATGRNNPEHMSFEEVQELREKLGGETRVVLTHLGPTVPVPADSQRYIVASDQARLRF